MKAIRLGILFVAGLFWLVGSACVKRPADSGDASSAAGRLFVPVSPNELAKASKKQLERLDHLQSHPSTIELNVVRVGLDLRRAEGRSVALDVAPGSSPVLDTDRVEELGRAGFAWIGRPAVDGDIRTYAVLVINGDDMVGTIGTVGDVFRVRPLGGGLQAIIRIDPEAFPPIHDVDVVSGTPQFSGGPANQCYVTTYIAPYTPGAVADVGGVGTLVSIIHESRILTNLAYENSDIHLRLSIVNWFLTDFEETGDIVADWQSLRSDGDGVMDEIHFKREAAGADLVVLFAGDYAGLAGFADVYAADPSQAFAIIQADSAAGPKYTFAHEVGHLQGGSHQVGENSAPVAAPMGRGFCSGDGWRTIMVNGSDGGTCTETVLLFSNPNVQHMGSPAGVAGESDNAFVLNSTACDMSGLMTTLQLGFGSP